MHIIFWIFCSFLIILTLISAIGGGIRYRENFMDEVLDDMYDSVDKIDSSVIRTLIKTTTNVIDEEEHVEKQVPIESVIVPQKINTPTVQGVTTDLSANYEVIEAFNGNVYATF